MQVIQNQQTLEAFREFFTGASQQEVTRKMDRRAEEVEPRGYTVVKRRKVGRNEACPCGSGVKFKKCCIDQAR